MKDERIDPVLLGYRGAAANIIESIGSFKAYDSHKAEMLDQIAKEAAKERDKIVRRGEKEKPSFHIWWNEEGSAMRNLPGEDYEEHAKRVSSTAWENGFYKGQESKL